MREKHPAIDADVEPDTPIWRYFDLPKLASFLQERALWFSRADLLGDPLEGSFTRARAAEREALLANPPDGKTREELVDIFKHNAAVFQRMVRCSFVNCWHAGNHESMAMWQGYGGGPFGVAIRSTFGTLDSLLPAAVGSAPMDTIFLARVRYVDYSSETERFPEEYNVYTPFTCKSFAYQHEREIRALFVDMTTMYTATPPSGKFIPLDIARLIHRVTVSPLAPPWYSGVVQSLLEKYDCKMEVTRSIVNSEPVF